MRRTLCKEANGFDWEIPDAYIIATKHGIVKRGMEEPRYDEIECLSQVIVRTIRNDTKNGKSKRYP